MKLRITVVAVVVFCAIGFWARGGASPARASDGPQATELEDELGRTIGSADADGPEYRITLQDGTQFFMKSPRIRGDSVVGYYRPTKGTEWARAAVLLYDVHIVEQQEVDWLATISLLTVPITLGLLLTY